MSDLTKKFIIDLDDTIQKLRLGNLVDEDVISAQLKLSKQIIEELLETTEDYADKNNWSNRKNMNCRDWWMHSGDGFLFAESSLLYVDDALFVPLTPAE